MHHVDKELKSCSHVWFCKRSISTKISDSNEIVSRSDKVFTVNVKDSSKLFQFDRLQVAYLLNKISSSVILVAFASDKTFHNSNADYLLYDFSDSLLLSV